MKWTRLLASSVILMVTANVEAQEGNKPSATKLAQCEIGQVIFDCQMQADIVGAQVRTTLMFADNKEGWIVYRSWDDSTSYAVQKSTNKKFKIETYWRDEDTFEILPFGEATEYSKECFKVIGSKQDFCWSEVLL